MLTAIHTNQARRFKRIVTVLVLVVALSVAMFLLVSDKGRVPLDATLTGSGSLTRADCFEMQRKTMRLTTECKALLFGSPSSEPTWGVTISPTTTALPAATFDPTAPTPTPKLPMGSKCLNNEQCSTDNCVLSADPSSPSLLIGTCGCRARPACLNSVPACALPETDDMCVCGNRQCEIGEKTSCPQDCLAIDDGPSCRSCLGEGFGYLCRGGFTGGTFCNAEGGGTGADFTCVACAQQPDKCVPEGQQCSTSADCGTCGATCVGDGMTATEPPSIINGKCAYSPRASASPIAMCDYAAPPEGCRYVPGPHYDERTACGLILDCPSDTPLPEAGKFSITLAGTIHVGDKADVTLCGNTSSGPFEGWATITIDAGPTADVPTYLSYEFIPEDHGCQTFPEAIQPIRTGALKLTAQDLHFSDLDSQDPTMTETVTRTVLPAEEAMCTQEAKLCPDGSYVGRIAPDCEFAACPGETPPETCNESRGNVNCDGSVDIADLAQLVHVLVGRASLHSSLAGHKNADMNGDGKVDIADLAALEKIVSALTVVQ